MKLILATLLLSVTFADLISNESSHQLKCHTSNGWKIFDKFDSEKVVLIYWKLAGKLLIK